MKYFATLGPNFSTYEDILEAIKLGLTGLRINLSHVDLESSQDWLQNIKKADQELNSNTEILLDIQGAELRIKIKEEFDLELDEQVYIGHEFTNNIYKEIIILEQALKQLEIGDILRIDDAKVNLEIVNIMGDGFIAKALNPVRIYKGKSMSVVDKNIILPSISRKDIENLEFAKSFGIESFMLPFVRNASVVKEFKDKLDELGFGKNTIYSKIEDIIGIENIDNIIEHSDEIVIARGDLGNNIGLLELPRIQKYLSKKCLEKNKPFMVVTELLASMVKNNNPTRAELNDIYNSTLDGASSLMLTGETAIGVNPLKAIEYLIKGSQI